MSRSFSSEIVKHLGKIKEYSVRSTEKTTLLKRRLPQYEIRVSRISNFGRMMYFHHIRCIILWFCTDSVYCIIYGACCKNLRSFVSKKDFPLKNNEFQDCSCVDSSLSEKFILKNTNCIARRRVVTVDVCKHFSSLVASFHTSRHCFMVGMPYNLEEEGDN